MLLNLIIKNIDSVDLDDAIDITDTLDILNEDTYLTYDNILSEIEDSFNDKDTYRIIRPNKTINSLITNDEYKNKVYALIKKTKS